MDRQAGAATPTPEPFRAGMHIAPPQFTPPEVRPGPREWERYKPPRFSAKVRVLITVGILLLPGFLVLAVLLQLTAEGRARAGFVIFGMPLIVLVPLTVWALRDLWGRGR